MEKEKEAHQSDTGRTFPFVHTNEISLECFEVKFELGISQDSEGRFTWGEMDASRWENNAIVLRVNISIKYKEPLSHCHLFM